MTSGGARNRSGPSVDPSSGRTDRRGLAFEPLPSEGFTGDPPKWPMPTQTDREAELWAWAWRTPQAVAWFREPWRWHSVAMWVRVAVVCEGPDALAADKSGLHRFADQIGLTPAGLKENGWRIAPDEVAKKRESKSEPTAPRKSARDRMTVVSGGA